MKIAIIANPIKDTDYKYSEKTAEYLLKKNIELYSDTEKISEKISVLPLEECISVSDIIITVGGDGTILHIAEIVARQNKPLLGINLGKVGYMAEIEPDEIELLDNLLKKELKTEKRMMLSFEVKRNGETVLSSDALNDIVVSRGRLLKMSEFILSEGGDIICNYFADGLIFSTPTGSTAYTLSAGGPIIDPKFDCIIATPICAHALSQSRSIVFRPESSLSIKLLSDNSPYLTADGGKNFLLKENDEIVVKKSYRELTLIKLKDQSFYEKLSHKLK